ncbi:unnamed protein product [Adineta steineri]|uniref:Uncharacterized protein n=1 Tax=Adineta steineri TaxID=433720 RepID=A0A813U8N5_9BILA|nr:unnamed protein product [Adineta steineri]CAF1409475.1 unnamed protein product [Adineta steineri]
MDLFAAILISITAVTICGICLFIFVCALQPRFLRKLHGKTSRAYQDAESNGSVNKNEDNLSTKSLDVAMQSTERASDDLSTSPPSNDREKKAYLKALEESLRTGRPIKNDEEDTDPTNNQNTSRLNPLNFIRHFINKHIRRRTSDI